jgi:hypothetical protein
MDNINLGTCMDYTMDPTGTKGTNGTRNNTRPTPTITDSSARSTGTSTLSSSPPPGSR